MNRAKLLFLALATLAHVALAGDGLHVGAAAAEFEADESMVIAGGIHEACAKTAEGKLRAVAVVAGKAAVREIRDRRE